MGKYNRNKTGVVDGYEKKVSKTFVTLDARIKFEVGKEYILIILGTFLMSVAVVMCFDMVEVVVGGVTGIAIILKSLFGVPMWVVNLGINFPLFILGFKILDNQSFVRTLVANFVFTVFLGVVPAWDILTGDLLVDIMLGSVFMGTGLGFVLRSYASSGGTDLLATLINYKLKYISVPKIMAFVDGAIVAVGVGVFGLDKGIYALIAIFIVTKVCDGMVEGPGRAKLLYIISSRSDDIGGYIIDELNRGATKLEVTGVYTENRKNMIMCVVSSREMIKIKQKTYQIDPYAICFIGDIREAFGEGFTSYKG